MKIKHLFTLLSAVIITGTAAQNTFAKEVVPTPEVASTAYDVTALEDRIAKLEYNDQHPSFEFHGYARTGLLLNAERGLKKASTFPGPFDKKYVGRLGNEDNTYAELEFVKSFYMENGAWAKFHAMLVSDSGSYSDNSGSGNDGWGDSSIQARQVYVEMGNLPTFTGAFKDSTVWAGKRYYNRRDIHITDYYYTDLSGTGLGVDNIALGEGKLGFATVARNSSVGDDQDIVGLVTKYSIGNFEFDLVGAKSQDNEDENSSLAKNGFQGFAQYNLNSYYGLNGFSKFYGQIGSGIGATWGLGSLGNATGNYKKATSYRLGTWGLTNLNEKWDLFTTLYGQYDNKPEDRDLDLYKKNGFETAFVVRPVYKINNNFELQFEGGIGYTESNFSDDTDSNGTFYKLTFAPTLKLDSNQFWARPEIRAFVTYVGGETQDTANNKEKYNDDNIRVGVQAEVWF